MHPAVPHAATTTHHARPLANVLGPLGPLLGRQHGVELQVEIGPDAPEFVPDGFHLRLLAFDGVLVGLVGQPELLHLGCFGLHFLAHGLGLLHCRLAERRYLLLLLR